MLPYAIMVSSQKGGVGKTTVAINLAAALTLLGRKTMLIEGNASSPSLALELGMDPKLSGAAKLLKGGKLDKCVSVHKPSGLHVLLYATARKRFNLGIRAIAHAVAEFAKADYEFIVVDTEPGYSGNKIMNLITRHVNEAIIVATPDMPSLSNLVKLAGEYDRKKLQHSLILNSMDPKNYSVSVSAIRSMYNGEILGELPRDDAVYRSAMKNMPVVVVFKNCEFSKEMMRIAGKIQGRVAVKKKTKIGSVFSNLFHQRED